MREVRYKEQFLVVGLRESFDVTKRMFIFQYIAQNIESRTPFSALFRKYQEDHQALSQALTAYRTDCMNEQAAKKFRTGLVRFKSDTSLNKYTRVAFELGLCDFEYERSNPLKGMLSPNDTSTVISSLIELQKKTLQPVLSFELIPSVKFLLSYILLQRDIGFILPLVFAIRDSEEPLEVSTIRKSIIENYATNLLNCLRMSTKLIPKSISSITNLYGRISVFEKYVAILRRSKKPHGIYHIFDPRLHWIYDLKFVDYSTICRKGIVEVAKFWELDGASLSKYYPQMLHDPFPILKRYCEMLVPECEWASPETIIPHAIKCISKHYSRLVPMGPFLLLTQSYSASLGKLLHRSKIVSYLQENGHRLYREFDGQLGYVMFDR